MSADVVAFDRVTDLSFVNRKSGLSGSVGGVLALAYPLGLSAVAIDQGFGRTGDSGLATAFLAAMVLLIALPTAWIFVFDFIEVSPFTAVVAGMISALPLWYLVGAAIARNSNSWLQWSRRYALACASWTALNLVILVLIAAL